MKESLAHCAAAGLLLVALLRPTSGADPARASAYAWVPETISTDGQRLLAKIGGDHAVIPTLPEPGDHDGWTRLQAAAAAAREVDLAAVRAKGVAVSRIETDGVSYFDIAPNGLVDDGSVVVYLHGGAFVYFEARGALEGMAKLARVFGRRIVVVDYRLAPAAKWPQITADVVAVVKHLLAGGAQMRRIAMFGDSAGGNLAVATTLKMRDEGLGLPGAVATWSLTADFRNAADTRVTLRDADPIMSYERQIKNAMLAYADEKDWAHPHVSPVHGDFEKGFPPALIQAGTREILLSDSVRLYQAIEAAGGAAKLDVYEGMPHVFQGQIPNAPESRLAVAKMKAFFDQHLAR